MAPPMNDFSCRAACCTAGCMTMGGCGANSCATCYNAFLGIMICMPPATGAIPMAFSTALTSISAGIGAAMSHLKGNM